MIRRRAVGLQAVVIGLAVATTAPAQSLDSSLARIREKVARGDELTIVDAGLGVTQGMLQGLSGSSLRVLANNEIRDVPIDQIVEIRRRGDSPWNGLLVGAVMGAAIGFGTFTECQPQPPEQVCGGNLTTSRSQETAAGAALFGAVGLAVDLFIDGWTSVYRSAVVAEPAGVRRTPIRLQAAPHAVCTLVALRF